MSLLFGIILSLLFGILPMALYALLLAWFDRYEKEPPLLMVGVFLWGLVVAAGSALILNTLFGVSVFLVTGSEGLANFGTAVFSAPLVEETVKGLAVLGVFLFFRHEFDSVLDGVIYGSLVGFGFAAAENVNYIFTGYLEAGFEGLILLVFIRTILIAFLHANLTAFTGIGFAVARLYRGSLAVLGPVLGFGAAVGAHTFHNLLASVGNVLVCVLGSVIDWMGFFGMLGFVLFLVWREGEIMREHLREEVDRGLITWRQFEAACSVSGQVAARWGAVAGGRRRQVSQFYDLCGELAFRKYQLARLGPEREPGAQAAIDKLRGQVAGLSQGVG